MCKSVFCNYLQTFAPFFSIFIADKFEAHSAKKFKNYKRRENCTSCSPLVTERRAFTDINIIYMCILFFAALNHQLVTYGFMAQSIV